MTGATSGIGRATALALAAQGYAVVAAGYVPDEVAACRTDPAYMGIEVMQLDVTDEAAVKRTLAGCGKLDVLVNAAGISRVGDEFTEDGFQRILATNLNGTMHCCYAARELLSRRGGAIVNIASTMSFFGSASAPAYAASKGAVAQFTKSLAMAWAAHSIRCNAVAPGWIDTQMTRALKADGARYPRVLARTPLGRLGSPAEVADAVVFLASARASFINGAILPVDGGYLIHGL